MELKKLEVSQLFDSLNHTIVFPNTSSPSQHAAVVIVHGRNGIGKTTLLKMLDGLLRLDFSTFRKIPFASAKLTFDNGRSISVTAIKKGGVLISLDVSYNNIKARLNPERSGPLDESNAEKVDIFRKKFFNDTSSIAFEYIDIERINRIKLSEVKSDSDYMSPADYQLFMMDKEFRRHSRSNPKSKRVRDVGISLDKRVAEFVNSAQINYRRFFSSTEPDLFPKILERLSGTDPARVDKKHLVSQLTQIRNQDKVTERLGLESDKWDYSQIISRIELLDQYPETKNNALTVLSVYAEHLASRAQERKLVADRLLTFERLVSEFFVGKYVTIDAREGMKIYTDKKVALKETDLSSGEYHLLYLMVSSLVTKQKGTVLAIDEPEMSMHIEWQRKLISALVECASGAEPLFIFATHSPDLAASSPESMIDLG